MKRIRLAEKDLTALIKRVIDEQQELNEMFVCASDQECIDATGDSRTRCDLGVGKCYVVGGNPPGMVTTGTNRGKGLQNRGRGEKATDSLRHTGVGGMISEKELGGRCKSPECRGKHAVWSRNPGGRGWFCDCVNGPHIEFEEEQIISLKETQLTKLINIVIKEQNNPFTWTGSGTGPNWTAAQALWQNYSMGQNAPAPPPAFLNRMSNMGCNGKNKRKTVLTNKWNSLFPVGGNTEINPNNPMWQSILASKIIWLINDINTNCQGV